MNALIHPSPHVEATWFSVSVAQLHYILCSTVSSVRVKIKLRESRSVVTSLFGEKAAEKQILWLESCPGHSLKQPIL